MKDAFLISVPFTMFGSLVLALANIPYMEKLMGADAVAAFQSAIGPIQNVTFNLIAVMVVLGIGYSLGKTLRTERHLYRDLFAGRLPDCYAYRGAGGWRQWIRPE